MSQSLVLQNTVKWAQPILKNQPLQVNGQEPGLTFGNFILQRMMGPPFRWRFNRKNFTFDIVEGTTDYPVTVTDLGHVESMWIEDEAGNFTQLTGRIDLERSSLADRPTEIAPVYDNGAGVVTFRTKPCADASYTAYCDYQAAPGLIRSFGMTWGNVPDNFSYIFNAGYLAMAMLLTNDTRFQIFERYFISSLLGAQEGLDQQAINIFVAQWTLESRTLAASMATGQAGAGGRGV